MSKKDGNFNYGDGVTLKEYMNEKCNLHMREVVEKFKSSENALNLARESMEKRLDTMNEFRDALKDASASFMRKEEYESKHALLQNQVDDLRMFKSALDAKANQSAVNIAFLISVLGLLMGIISFFRK